MPALNARRVLGILESLDWQGHVELPMIDMTWLSHEIAAKLTSTDFQRCDSCGAFKSICVPTGLGKMCEDCIDTAVEAMDSAIDNISEKHITIRGEDDEDEGSQY